MQPVQDTVQFGLSAEETVTNNTVKVIAHVVALKSTDLNEQMLKEAIREVVQQFIVADWSFSNMTRNNHPSGVEQVNLTATARVPEAENHALDQRRVTASRPGLTIHSHTIDISPTARQIDEAQSRLRLNILQKAQAECEAVSQTLGEQYRLGDVDFGESDEFSASNAPRRMAAASTYGSGFDHAPGGSADAIGNAVKLTMQAVVQLRISR